MKTIGKVFTFSLLILLPLNFTKADTHLIKELGIPDQLQPWVEWIKAERPEWNCSISSGGYECLWPSYIKYDLRKNDAAFNIKVRLLKRDKLEIPSEVNLMPANLEIRDIRGEVINPPLEVNNNKLFAELEAGAYEISGKFFWDKIPGEIPLPQNYGIFEISLPEEMRDLQYARVANAVRFHNKAQQDKTGSLNLRVYRRISDGSPMQISTLMRLQVSGAARAFQFGKFLPKNSHIISVQSALPYQISSDGNLSLQLLPGKYDLYFNSVLRQPVNYLELPLFDEAVWPEEETWSWNANPEFRSVEITGGRAVEVSLTDLPSNWRTGASYLVNNGSKLELKEIRRGKEEKPFSSLHLTRNIWIDLNGEGYTASDNFNGRVEGVSRLNALKETKLGRADLGGVQQLITLDPANDLSGIEIRENYFSLNTVSRIAGGGTLSSIGWDTKVDSLNINLNLPPSWLLLGTLNASSVQNSWLESWTLFEVFILILITVATYRVFGIKIALLVSVSAVLNYREFLEPNILIIHIILLEVCRRLIKDKESFFHKLTNWLLISTFALWTLATLTFVKLQFTQTLFPQLQSGTRYRTLLQEILLALENSLFSWPILLLILALVIYGGHRFFIAQGFWKKSLTIIIFGTLLLIIIPLFFSTFRFYGYSSAGFAPASSELLYNAQEMAVRKSAPFAADSMLEEGKVRQQQSKVQIFQSGPATPDWRWRSHSITISGPVAPDHKISFLLLPPNFNRTISAARCAVSLILIFLLFQALNLRLSMPKVKLPSGAATAILFCCFFWPLRANAEFPSKEMLTELEKRLASKLCNTQSCALIKEMQIKLSETDITFYLDVSSEGKSSIFLPGPLDTFQVRAILNNGQESAWIKNTASNHLKVKTEDGRNRIEVRLALPDSISFSLEFLDKPLHAKVSAENWHIEGLSAAGRIERGLLFTRKDQSSAIGSEAAFEQTTLTSWVVAKRNFEIGEEISVTTELERIGDTTSSLKLALPLIEGEMVTNQGLGKENNTLNILIPAGVKQFIVNSRLALVDELLLREEKADLISQQWTVACQNFVSCRYSGINPTYTQISGRQSYQWNPFEGEEVKLKIKTLDIAEGEHITIDKVISKINWGSNRRSGNVQFTIRTTKQESFEIKFLQDDLIENVLVNNMPGIGKISDSKASILLPPGNHNVNVNYAKPWQPDIMETAPQFTSSAKLNNFYLTVSPSVDRWLVWTGGGFWGPSVVFWAKLIVLILLIFALVKLQLLLLTWISALFLSLGLATLPIIYLSVPLAWLISLRLIPLFDEKIFPQWKKTRAAVFWLLSFFALLVFYNMVRSGLVLQPPMLIVGNNSSYYMLKWYFDSIGTVSPEPWVVSLPLWSWRALALVWSGWFVFVLFEWLKDTVEIGRSLSK